jgi:hypothetical protein
MEQVLQKLIVRSASQEIRRFLWNPKVHYRVHNSPPTVPTLIQMNTIHTLQTYFTKIHLILSSHVSLGLPSGLLPSGSPTKILHAFLIAPMHATCPAHLIFLDLIIVIFGE